MFFSEFQKDNLSHLWGEFSKVKKSYTSQERWKEIVDSDYKNVDFVSLTLDGIIYDFYKNTYNEELEKECVPFMCTSMMIILAKKANIDYDVEMVLAPHEFTTYFETTRLESLFDNTRDVSELQEDFKKYEEKIREVFPEDLTLWNMLNINEYAKKFDELCDDPTYGFQFIDVFTNMMAYDFVKNYLLLPNERDLTNVYNTTNDKTSYDDEDDCNCCVDGCYTVDNSDYRHIEDDCGCCV